MAKFGVNADDFLDWYFEDDIDYKYIGQCAEDALRSDRNCRSISVKSLFDITGYIPAKLLIPLSSKATKDLEELEEVDPSECKLIYKK